MNTYENASARHRAMVDELLADTAKNGGLAPVDLAQFWKDQELARANPFGQDIPQMPLGAVFAARSCPKSRTLTSTSVPRWGDPAAERHGQTVMALT